MKTSTMTAFCRSCRSRILFTERPEIYDLVICPECEEEFEVVGLAPIRLDWPSDYEEDSEEWSEFDRDD
jgi:lysine biosynthesis protein LysW